MVDTQVSTEHTPTPWRMFGTTIGALGYGAICRMVEGPTSDSPGLRIDSPRFEEIMRDAEFIVRAANAHDALVAACEAARQQLNSAAPGTPNERQVLDEAIDAALKLTRGES